MTNKIQVDLNVGTITDMIEDDTLGATKSASSPVGPPPLICKPCGHSWGKHDDSGCLWYLCLCYLPGERK